MSRKTWKSKLSTRLNTVKTRVQNRLQKRGNWCTAYDIPNGKMQLLQELNFTEEQIEEVRNAFLIYDKNLNGTIHTDKLVKVMRALGKNPTEEEIEDMKFDAYTDMDGNGVIHFLEFVEMFACYRPDTEATLKEALELFDDEGSGYLNIKTFCVTMTTQGAKLGEDEVYEMVKDVSKNDVGDANINQLIQEIQHGNNTG